MSLIGNLGLVLRLAWLTVVLSVISIAWWQKTAFDTSLIALLPATEQQPVVEKTIEMLSDDFANQAALIVSSEDPQAARDAVAQIAKQLHELDGISVQWRFSDEQEDYLKELYPYRFSLLSKDVRERLVSAQYEHQSQLSLQRIFSPFSGVSQNPITDPFSLYTDLLLERQAAIQIKPEQELFRVVSSEFPAYLITLKLHEDPFSLTLQQRLLTALEPLTEALSSTGVVVHKSGLIWHAAAGAEQAESEITTIGFGSVLGIVVLIGLIFRSLRPLGMVTLVVGVGCIMAVSVTQLIFGRVHLITLAFGAGLVGVSVDYAMHFLCARQVHANDRVLKVLIGGLSLGLLSSVIAYAGLSLAPFPGLRQMAVFSVIGLIAAWLTVVLWLPYFHRTDALNEIPAAKILARAMQYYPNLQARPVLVSCLLLLVLMGSYTVWRGEAVDDIRLLQTSTDEMVREDRQVQALLGYSSSSRFILITADSLEKALQKEEVLTPELDKLIGVGELNGYQALSSVFPSRHRQQENLRLVNRLYEDQLPKLAKSLRLSEQQYIAAITARESLTQQPLTNEEWSRLQSSKPWHHLLVSSEPGESATVIRLQGGLSPLLEQRIEDLTEPLEGIYYVDRVKDLSDTMTDYREQIVQWLLTAYGVVVLLLLPRYRMSLWRVLLPPLAASLIAFALVIYINGGYNLFNLIALMLVLGIGLDMGIFLLEDGYSSHTWLAVSMSTFTSLLAFGLLALSNTPVLYHFGIVVLPGLMIVWLMTPMMRVRYTGE